MVISKQIIEAQKKGVKWLLDQRNPDGSIGPVEKGLFYYRVPWAFAVTGRTKEASMNIEWIKNRIFTEKGDFEGRNPQGYGASAYTYPNANFIYGAHIHRRFDISIPGINFLKKFQEPETGGFYNKYQETGPSGFLDIWTSSQAGLTCLTTGYLKAAEKTGEFLEMMYNIQPDIENKLYNVFNPGEGLAEKFPMELEPLYVVDVDKPLQYYFMPGIAAAHLSRLYMATGEMRWLKSAKNYLEFALSCSEDMYHRPQVGKVGWGAALYYTATKDTRFRELALKVAEYLVDAQEPEGYWLNIKPYREYHQVIEVTSEFIVHLNTILGAISTR